MTDEQIVKALLCWTGKTVKDEECEECSFGEDCSLGEIVDAAEKRLNELKAENASLRNEADENAALSMENKMRADCLEKENAALRERLEKAYEFPVKYGDKIWVLDGKHLFDRYVWAIEIKSNGVFLSLSEKTMWYDRGIVSLSERGKTWFLDSEKELAEARLAELKGDKE